MQYEQTPSLLKTILICSLVGWGLLTVALTDPHSFPSTPHLVPHR